MPLVESDLCANCQRCDGIILYHISVLFGDTGTHSISGNLYGAHGAR